jgi:hypothetical protein
MHSQGQTNGAPKIKINPTTGSSSGTNWNESSISKTLEMSFLSAAYSDRILFGTYAASFLPLCITKLEGALSC